MAPFNVWSLLTATYLPFPYTTLDQAVFVTVVGAEWFVHMSPGICVLRRVGIKVERGSVSHTHTQI